MALQQIRLRVCSHMPLCIEVVEECNLGPSWVKANVSLASQQALASRNSTIHSLDIGHKAPYALCHTRAVATKQPVPLAHDDALGRNRSGNVRVVEVAAGIFGGQTFRGSSRTRSDT